MGYSGRLFGGVGQFLQLNSTLPYWGRVVGHAILGAGQAVNVHGGRVSCLCHIKFLWREWGADMGCGPEVGWTCQLYGDYLVPGPHCDIGDSSFNATFQFHVILTHAIAHHPHHACAGEDRLTPAPDRTSNKVVSAYKSSSVLSLILSSEASLAF